MSLEELSYISQIVGVFAILGSLIAIFFQMRQGNRITRAQMTAQVSDRLISVMQNLIADKALANAFRAVMFQGKRVDDDEVARLLSWFNTWLHMHHSAFVDSKDGLVDSRTLEFAEISTHWYISKPLFASEWRRTRPSLPAAFVDHINSRAAHFAERVEALDFQAQLQE